MRLIKRSSLYLRSGNVDKVYEIDLCELNETEYLVNFRYGQRGYALTEGSKTPATVSKERAILIFSLTEEEKIRNGYQYDRSAPIAFKGIDNNYKIGTREGSILQRLADIVNNTSSFKTQWKPSRVIWKAVQLELTEALPYILQLAGKGDAMQQYTVLYALTLMKEPKGLAIFYNYIEDTKQPAYISNIALEGILTVGTHADINAVRAMLIDKLPVNIREAINNKEEATLCATLSAELGKDNSYCIASLYILTKVEEWIKPVLLKELQRWSVRPPFFKQIRAIYKLAQCRKDAQMIGVVAYKFEQEDFMYTASANAAQLYIQELEEYVDVKKELKSDNSRLAFSRSTKIYLQKNAANYLEHSGLTGDARTYIRNAVAILLQYKDGDYSAPREAPRNLYGVYDARQRMYTYELYQYPACSSAILLSRILYGNDPSRKQLKSLTYVSGLRTVWSPKYYYSADAIREKKTVSDKGDVRATDKTSLLNTAISFLGRFFGKKESSSVEQQSVNIINRQEPLPDGLTRLELYPDYWDHCPEAYIQLMMQATMELVALFALAGFKAHPSAMQLQEKLSNEDLISLLNRDYEQVRDFAFNLFEKRKLSWEQEPELVMKMLESKHYPAVNWAKEVITVNKSGYLDKLDILMRLLFNVSPAINEWLSSLLKQYYFTEERLKSLLGKTITTLLSWQNNKTNNDIAAGVIERIKVLAGSYYRQLDWSIITSLLNAPLASCKVLGADMLMEKVKDMKGSMIPFEIINELLIHPLEDLRRKGIELLNQCPVLSRIQYKEALILHTQTVYVEVYRDVWIVLQSLLARDVAVGTALSKTLLYNLIRKEKFEGGHQLMIRHLKELAPFWKSGIDARSVIKLVHAAYRDCQLLGYEMLETIHPLNEYSIGQIISLGGHELLQVRQLCWKFYTQNIVRIKTEKNKALNILDAKWEDTRNFAFNFFKEHFDTEDWDADTLIAIVDSTRPDVEHFGKELILKHFKEEHAAEYLTKLSEHPGHNVQALVSGYLNTFVADNPVLLQQLLFYFQGVLCSVNKKRLAKNRIFSFLHQEAIKSSAVAGIITPLLDNIAAQDTIQDKGTCVYILTDLKARYPHLTMHLSIKTAINDF